jgi:hypothetical protein
MSDDLVSRLDTEVPHSARIWNFWLGGKDNFTADRRAGEEILKLVPRLVTSARADRGFLARVVRYLAEEEGVRQFLDIGTGIPTADNTHEVAQDVAPDARIVYVDNDPMVLAHARALLTSTREGKTAYIDSDVHEPATILRGAAATLDFSRPVAIMMLGIVNFIVDDDEADRVVSLLLDGVAPGSFLVISHPTTEVDGAAMTEAVDLWNRTGSSPMVLRNRDQVARLFDGLDLLEPGVVTCSHWRPDPYGAGSPDEVSHYGAVGRKP